MTSEARTAVPGTRFPLTPNQLFLCGFDQGDEQGPFGPRYAIVHACRLAGPLDVAALRAALDDVVVRHSALRTLVVRGEDPHQLVLPPAPVRLRVHDLTAVPVEGRDRRAEELVLEVETGDYRSDEVPLLHAVLGRFDEADAVLVLVAHHAAADEWSMQLVLRDVLAGHAARVAEGAAAPAEPVAQYTDYALWEQERAATPAAARSREYWAETLRDAVITTLPTDHPRSAALPKTTAWQRFALSEDLTAAVHATAAETRSSPFMVLLAGWAAFLHRRTGADDVVVNTFTSGRAQAAFHETVGSFFNFVPLRIDLAGCGTFREAVGRVRRTCLDAYRHDVPFVEIFAAAPTLMNGNDDGHALCAFQVYRSPLPADGTAGPLVHREIRRRLLPQSSGGDIPDGAMWHLDVEYSGAMTGGLGFNTNLFDAGAMTLLTAEFQQALKSTVGAPDTRLDQI